MFMFSAIEGASLHTKTFYDLTGSEGRVALAAFCLLPKVTGVVVPGPPPRKPKTAAEVHQNIEKQLLAQLAPPAEVSRHAEVTIWMETADPFQEPSTH